MNEIIWQHFMAWLADAPAFSGPHELLLGYRAHLEALRKAAPEVEDEITAIQALWRVREEGWSIMFDKIYAAGETGGFSTAPNALVVEFARNAPPGRALDVGMGQGRNAVFLAQRGWTVTGFDLSEAGLAIARANARRAGVALNAVHASDKTFDYGVAAWDLIVFMYEPFPITAPDYVARLRRALAPGGHIVVESFSVPEGAPNRPATAIDADRLRTAFADFRVIRYEDEWARADWGPERKVVRLIAQTAPAQVS